MSSESNQTKNETSADQPSPNNAAPVPSSLEHGTSRQQETEMGHTCLQPLGSQTESWPSKPDGERLEVDLNLDRRKRRRTSSPKSNESSGCDQVHASFERPSTPNTPDSQKGIDGPVNETTTPLTMTTRLAAEEPRGQPLDTNNTLPSHVNVPMDAKEYKALGNDSKDLPKASSASASTRETKNNTTLHGWANPPQGDLVVTEAAGDEGKPKKILRLNPKTGTIGSPPAKTRIAHPEVVQKTMRASRQKQPASKLVIVRYGQETGLPSETGQKIDQILGGSATATSLISSPPLKRKPISRKVAGANPGATPHPFFLAKTTVNASAIQEHSSSTSEEKTIPRRQDSSITYLTGPKFPKRPLDKAPTSAFSAFGGFGAKNPKILKFPGAVEPAWPWKGMTHIRDKNEIQAAIKFPTNSLPIIPPKTRKSKHQAVEVLAGEDVIDILAAELCISSIVQSTREINADEYPALPECLRVPTRHVTTGLRVQNLVQKELSASFSPSNVNKGDCSSEDEFQASSPKKKPVHPAIANLYGSLATSLSAFDQSRCETQSWTQKYSPKAAAEVLQTGREAMILKEWLQTLTVQSVETGARDRSGSRASSVSRHSAVPGKRKQRSKKLEGFIVSSDEDEGDMDEISELEDDALLHGSQGTKRTVVRSNNADAKGSGRLANAIVISGSHGCGKTAAVYAVAKELGFEIFEINSSSRRSGKDILEKVGDMTHNHLVQSTQKEAPAEPIDEDAQRIADALESDIKSGRQGTMNSFFKPKESAKAKDRSKKREPAVIEIDAIKTKVGPKAPPKQQKQSLILFEEADILYEEDKQFWATVMAMIIQSKRPIIITCTDESVIPLDCMSLHAIIRFPQPPVDLAIDYMLLVAANEGHLLRRDAVKSLYESRGLDLRSSMTELNFWCQFAVGDVKGGLEWLYTRWPPGSDIDELGHIIRVMSEGTYETGMGWFSQDFLKSGLQYLAVEDEISHEVWDGWHLDLGDYDKSLGIAAWATEMQSQAKGRIRDAAAVNIYSDYLDAMSAADICASGAFAPDNKVSTYGS